MQNFVFSFLSFAACAFLATAGDFGCSLEQLSPLSRYILFPDSDGNMYNVDLEAGPDKNLIKEIFEEPSKYNQYLLFTRRNPEDAQTLKIYDKESIANSYFNPNVSTAIIAHGWISSKNSQLNPTIRDAYLNKEDANVIVLDWSKVAVNFYSTAVAAVPHVGRGLGQFLIFLREVTGTSFNKMHIIGHSLGGHLVGNAGRTLKKEANKLAARVTALDPAGPCWYNNRNSLYPTDAEYVEAIHTNAGIFGIDKEVGIANFYLNGGLVQPECDILNNICSHNRAWKLFAASVTHNQFIGRQCKSAEEAKKNIKCSGEEFLMGNDKLKKNGYGVYSLKTKGRYPYYE